MSQADQARSVSDFERAIFPIWKGIEQKDIAREQAMSLSDVSAMLTLAECLTMHKQDLRIYESGIKPHRMSTDQVRMDAIRAKATRAAGRSE